MLEKNRRAHLKNCFDNLRDAVPGSEDIKQSTVAIIQNATKYIEVCKPICQLCASAKGNVVSGAGQVVVVHMCMLVGVKSISVSNRQQECIHYA